MPESEGVGGGVLLAEGNLVMINSTVRDNELATGAGMGGGIYAGPGAHVVLVESTVESNTVDGGNALGGGIASAGELTVIRSTIRANANDAGSATWRGLYVSGGTGRVERSTISGNSAGRAGRQGSAPAPRSR